MSKEEFATRIFLASVFKEVYQQNGLIYSYILHKSVENSLIETFYETLANLDVKIIYSNNKEELLAEKKEILKYGLNLFSLDLSFNGIISRINSTECLKGNAYKDFEDFEDFKDLERIAKNNIYLSISDCLVSDEDKAFISSYVLKALPIEINEDTNLNKALFNLIYPIIKGDYKWTQN